MRSRTESNKLAISRGFSAEDLNGVRSPGSVHWLILASRLDQEFLDAVWNSALISTENALGLQARRRGDSRGSNEPPLTINNGGRKTFT